MDKKPKRVHANSPAQIPFARPKYGPRPDNHIWKLVPLAILPDQFVLFKLSETVSITTLLRGVLQRAGLVKQSATFHVEVRINRKGTNVHKALGLPKLEEGVH